MTRRDIFKFFAGIPAVIKSAVFGETISYPDQVDFSIPEEHKHLLDGDCGLITPYWNPPAIEHWEARIYCFKIHDAKTGKHLESRWTPYIAGRKDSNKAVYELFVDQLHCEETWIDRGYQIESSVEINCMG